MSAAVSTKLTKLFNITSPIVSAPMAYATTPALVAEVIKAGGLGFLAAGNEPAPKLAQALDEARAAVGKDKQHLVGFGFVGCILDMFNTAADPRLKTVLDKTPSAVWLAYGKDLGKYVAQVREHNAAHNTNILVFLTVNTVEEALRAANELKVDVIVAQGAEAGGRGSVYSPPTGEFLQATLAAVPDGPPILAAGGVTTGAQIAALLTKGAAGVVIGTRLLFTHECMFSADMKQVLVEAGSDATARSPAYDVAFPPGIWPQGIEARCITNAIVADYKAGLDPLDRKTNLASGKKEYLLVYAGTGVGDVKDIRSAAEVVQELNSETISSLKTLGPQLLA
ncbi:hypothetical protein POSPLADRAFT_1176997 [Postia placenta MAD-698-R-SB12]|uniref:Nitronate monooxygenase domain-containing protein n=1 Tax=Postia placenta MAD-698-R-SB12 TaxID=670580 RepID=A0A1X6NH86_9APHY|nr:hypothetical protein POSPLADRAFT_1176997 [Postia placenta MAD-698-R-SB12]OSX67985.1 hypothetical protein POSPLADRAFT_1176997 [Postia placenta MAD-698-R-SB12]